MGTRNCAAPALSTGGSRPRFGVPGECARSGESLIDARFDFESCGVGFVATLDNQPSHDILTKALTALSRLAHRGAVAADGKSSDGIGIHTAIPRELLLASTGFSLDPSQPLAVGMVFLAAETSAAAIAEHELEQAIAAQGFSILGWRDVPTRPEILGEIARSTLPVIRQVLLTDATPGTYQERDRRLYLARKQFERSGAQGYVCSLSSSSIIYKAMCAARLLPEFYPDLADERFVTPFALFHQRYATNVAPSWDRAQPFRILGHNGEINTIWGNRARMTARAATLPDDLRPIFTPSGSDSTSLDEVIELLARNGRTVAEAVRMVMPPGDTGRHSAFLAYHGDCIEPWDGPAAVSFTDGHLIGAALDRNGLRPCRFFVTEDHLIVAGSEAGLVDLDPEKIVHSGRLGPGQMLLADLENHVFYEDDELQALFDKSAPEYEALLESATLDSAVPVPALDPAEVNRLQLGFGYTKEDVNMILKPMAMEGKDAVWSMGDDTPIAPLARTPRPVYAFFRQRFAQVTNPPIDSLREACVIQLHTRLGPWPHVLGTKERLPGLSLSSPFLSLSQMESLHRRKHDLASNLPLAVLECVFNPACNLLTALDDLGSKAIELVRGGAAILLLTDRGCGEQAIPIPMALATGAVHHALIRVGERIRVGLAVEAADCRDLHHAAVLLGMGAGAICPWLALETARQLNPEQGEANLLHAFDLGLAKIMSKMGISVVDSYRGAHLFDCLGLSREVVERCFEGTPAPLGGIGFPELEASLREMWLGAQCGDSGAENVDVGDGGGPLVTVAATKDLPDYGWIRFRKADKAEPHGWQPQTVRLLQTITGATKAATAAATDSAQAWGAFTSQAKEKEPTVLRDLLEVRAAAEPLPVVQVEPAENLYRRFIASAMSLGSLSPEAHQTITAAMNMLGGRSNTGEGGEDPAVYELGAMLPVAGSSFPSELLNNKVKQVASARFGVTAQYAMHA
jgi:glutamate synthase (NADPH/NADH) large chain